MKKIDAASLGAAGVRTVEAFKDWMRQTIRSVLPHQAYLAGYGHIHAAGVSLDYAVLVDYPTGYLKDIRNRAGGIESPIMRRWFATHAPVIFEADHPWPDVTPEWLQLFRKHGLQNALAHAVYDAPRCVGTYHCFYRLPGRIGDEHVELAKALVPILHDTLCRVMTRMSAPKDFAARLAELSPREQEILQWVRLGKTNGEIASIAKLSENTVKHHLTRLFTKLEVENRAQLISRLSDHDTRAAPGYPTRVF